MEKLCVIKMRSSIKKRGKIQVILGNLGLYKLYSCTIVDGSQQMRGMLKEIDSVIAYGELSKEAAAKLLAKRSMASNIKRYDWKSGELTAFIDDFMSGKKKLVDLKIKRIFRLHPPAGGFERAGKKVAFSLGGAVGYRGKEIANLLERMI